MDDAVAFTLETCAIRSNVHGTDVRSAVHSMCTLTQYVLLNVQAAHCQES